MHPPGWTLRNYKTHNWRIIIPSGPGKHHRLKREKNPKQIEAQTEMDGGEELRRSRWTRWWRLRTMPHTPSSLHDCAASAVLQNRSPHNDNVYIPSLPSLLRFYVTTDIIFGVGCQNSFQDTIQITEESAAKFWELWKNVSGGKKRTMFRFYSSLVQWKMYLKSLCLER